MSDAFRHDPATDRDLRLADGRRMRWSEFGAPDGTPVLSCHGGLLCRFDVEPCAADFAAAGLRVVSPDRPGVGRLRPGAGSLHRGLGRRRPPVARLARSRSGGGHRLVARRAVRSRGRGAPRSARHRARARGRMPAPRRRRSFRRAQRDGPPAGPALAEVGATRARRVHDDRPARPSLAVATRALRGQALARERRRGDRSARRVARRRDGGGRTRRRGHGRRVPRLRGSVGLSPSTRSRCPTHVHQGTADTLVPPKWADELVAAIPNATLTTYDGEGHLIGISRRAEITTALVSSPDEQRRSAARARNCDAGALGWRRGSRRCRSSSWVRCRSGPTRGSGGSTRGDTGTNRRAARAGRRVAGPPRVARLVTRVRVEPEPVGAPLPHVAGDVVQTQVVGGERVDRRGGEEAVGGGVAAGERSLEHVHAVLAAGLEVVAPREGGADPSAARRALPFGLASAGASPVHRQYATASCHDTCTTG